MTNGCTGDSWCVVVACW